MSEEREEITEETAPLPLKMQEAPAPIQESENKAQTDGKMLTLSSTSPNALKRHEKNVHSFFACLLII